MKMLYHTDCIYVVSPQCVFSYDLLDDFSEQKSFATLATRMWFVPSVYMHMSFKITCICKSLVTMVALMWFILGVYIHMPFKINSLWKSHVTLTAFIWFLPSVYIHMPFKINSLWKKPCHIDSIYMVSPQCVLAYVL